MKKYRNTFFLRSALICNKLVVLKHFIVLIFSVFLFYGCFWGDEETTTTHLTKDFNLSWWGSKKSLSVFLNQNPNEYGGSIVVDETVFEIGYNDQFIIAKQHPNKEKDVSERLFGNLDSLSHDFYLEDPADTIYLAKDDSIYEKGGKWFHISNGWNPPDSLYPYKKVTYFHIIDIRQYVRGAFNSYKTYTFDSPKAFDTKRKELGIPDKLQFISTDTVLH